MNGVESSEVARRLLALRQEQDVDPPAERALSEYSNMVTMQVHQTHLATCRSIRAIKAGQVVTMQAQLRAETADGTLVALVISCECGGGRVVAVRVL